MNKEEFIKKEIFEHYDIKLFDISKTNQVYELILKMWNEYKQLKENRDKAIEILGEYKHYTVPDEKQNSENEDIVDKSLEILKGNNNE